LAPVGFRKLQSVEGRKPESILESLGALYCQFNIRPIISALRQNAIVAQTGDGWHSAGFIDVDFLGRKMPFTNGVMNIARRTGAAIVPMFVTGRPPALRRVIERPFGIEDGDELRRRVGEYASRLEEYLLESPETWRHFAVPETLTTLEGWKDRPLEERYEL
jgi:lauroyl/myristoyl acyltransferase